MDHLRLCLISHCALSFVVWGSLYFMLIQDVSRVYSVPVVKCLSTWHILC